MAKFILTLLLTFFGSVTLSSADTGRLPDFTNLHIKAGMKRSVLENNIAKIAEFKSSYIVQYPTESTLRMTYVINGINLHVIFKQGQPVPYIQQQDGHTIHLPPVEQTVLSWRVDG